MLTKIRKNKCRLAPVLSRMNSILCQFIEHYGDTFNGKKCNTFTAKVYLYFIFGNKYIRLGIG